MGYVLLWIFHLAFSLSFLGALTIQSSKAKRKLLQWGWPLLFAVLLLLTHALTLVLGAIFLSKNIQPSWLFWYGLTHVVVFCVFSVLILKRGLGKNQGKSMDTVLGRKKTWVWVSLGSLILFFLVLDSMDQRLNTRMITLRLDAKSSLVTLLPGDIPRQLNGYPDMMAATRYLDNHPLPKWFREADMNTLDPVSNRVRTLLEDNEPVLVQARNAALKPGFSIGYDISDPLRAPLPPYTSFIKTARLLSLSSRNNAAGKKFDAAFLDLSAIQSIAEHMYSYPILISFMVGKAVDKVHTRTLEQIMAEYDLPLDKLSLPALPPQSLFPSLQKALSVESYFMPLYLTEFTLQDTAASLAASDYLISSPNFMTAYTRILLLPAEISVCQDLYLQVMNKPAGNYNELKTNLQDLETAYEEGRLGVFSAMSFPDFDTFIDKVRFAEMSRWLKTLAMACETHKQVRGAYPETLDQLIPAYMTSMPDIAAVDSTPVLERIDGGLKLWWPVDQEDAQEGLILYLGGEAYRQNRLAAGQ